MYVSVQRAFSKLTEDLTALFGRLNQSSELGIIRGIISIIPSDVVVIGR